MATIDELLIKIGVKADTASINQVQNSMDGLRKTARNTAIAFGAISAAAAGVFAFIGTGAGEFEQLEIAFETMLGSAEKAQKMLQDITEFTKQTPFQLEDTVTGAKRLLAMGIESNKVIKTLEMLGNISAGVGREKLPFLILALGQVRAAGKLTGQELRQFTEAGVPLLEELAKGMGTTTGAVKEMISKGQVSFKNVEAALAGLTGEGGKFGNLMQKQMQTFLGVFSNIKDSLKFMQIEIGRKLLPAATKTFKTILDWLTKNQQKIIDLSTTILEKLIPALKVVAKIVAVIAGAFVLKAIGSLTIGLFNVANAFTAVGNAALAAQVKAIGTALLVGAAVAGLILIVEDLWLTFSDPKADTVFRDLLDMFKVDFPIAFKIWEKAFTAAFDTIFFAMRLLVDGFKLTFGLIAKLFGSDDMFNNAMKSYAENFKSIAASYRDIFNTGDIPVNLMSEGATAAEAAPGPQQFMSVNRSSNATINQSFVIQTTETSREVERSIQDAKIQMQLRAKGL